MSLPDLPGAVQVLLSLTLPKDWRPDILRDLQEAWLQRRRDTGVTVAHAWLWGQALSFSLRFAPERVGELLSAPVPASTDLKLALRWAARAPLVTLLTVLSLGVGIGASVGGYTLIEGTFFTPFPFEGGDRIMLVQDYDRGDRFAVDVGADEYLRRRDGLESFEVLSAFLQRSLVVGEGERGTVARAYLCTPGFLRMTGVSPWLGRLADEGDVLPGADPVVVLPYASWVGLMGSDPDAIGRRIEIGGVTRTVIGVMPEGFGFPTGETMWIPFDARDADAPLRMIGKLREGVDVRTARAELAAVARPDPTQVTTDQDIVHLVTSYTRPLTDPRQIWVLAIPVSLLVLLLVVMATNIANLMLARNAGRASELAVRSALGASRTRVVGQLVLEVAVMVVVAAGLGVWLSRLGMASLESRVDLPVWADLSLDPGAVLFCVLLAGLVTFVAGAAPALRTTGRSPGDALRDGGRGASGVGFGRLTGALIVVQVTISVGFLSAAALLGQSLLTYGFERYGLPAEETVVWQLYFGWPEELSDPDAQLSADQRSAVRRAFLTEVTRKRGEIRDAVQALPGVRFSAYGSRFPGNESERATVEIEGLDTPPSRVEIADVGAGYLELLDAGVLAGRDFTPEERGGGVPAVLVNAPFVRDVFGGANPLGRRVRIVPEDAADPEEQGWATVVGVVPDLALNPGNPSNAAAIFRPLEDINVVRLAARGEGQPGPWTPRLIRIAQEVDPRIRVQWATTLAAQMREPVAIFRTLGLGFLVMGALALLLSSASIHALTASTVTRRTREIGIRQALGAGAGRIVREVTRRATAQLAVGMVLGTGLALGLLRLSRVFPWEVRQGNPVALGLVIGAMVLAGAAALARPLRRALSIRPAEAMRAE